MKSRWSFLPGIALALSVYFAGCEQIEVVSVEPIIPDSEAIFDPELVGLWGSNEAESHVALFRAPSGEDVYSYWALDRCAGSEARLGRLGGHLVMEISCPERVAADLLLPHHRWLVLKKIGPDEIHTWKLEAEVLQEALQAGELNLAHLVTDDVVILYDSAASIRTQLVSYLGRPGVLADPWIWERAAFDFDGLLTRPGQFKDNGLPCFEASPWPEADALFARDARWADGSVVSSVALGDGKVLWLINNVRLSALEGGEPGAVTNAVAVQSGADPATATIELYVGASEDGSPAAVIAGAASERLYFRDGVRVADRLLLLMTRQTRPVHLHWALMMVDNPGDEPASWRLSPLDIPVEAMEAIGTPIGLLAVGEHVYLLGAVKTPFDPYWVYVLRWPRASVLAHDLATPQWLMEPGGDVLWSWVPGLPPADRVALFETDTTDITVHVDPVSGFFLAVQTSGYRFWEIMLRGSPLLTEEWTEPRLLYRPPRYGNVHAKAHPGLAGADLVLTYVSPGGPRFLRLARCDAGVEP